MITGVGIDLVELTRVESALSRHGDRFAERILSVEEWNEFQAVGTSQRVAFLAKRFAAKEAFAKAVGLGIGRGFGFQDLSVVHTELGQPGIALNSECLGLAAYASQRIHLSLTDERSMCAALCVVEQSS